MMAFSHSYNAATVKLLGAKPDVEVLDLNGAVSAVCGAETSFFAPSYAKKSDRTFAKTGSGQA